MMTLSTRSMCATREQTLLNFSTIIQVILLCNLSISTAEKRVNSVWLLCQKGTSILWQMSSIGQLDWPKQLQSIFRSRYQEEVECSSPIYIHQLLQANLLWLVKIIAKESTKLQFWLNSTQLRCLFQATLLKDKQPSKPRWQEKYQYKLSQSHKLNPLSHPLLLSKLVKVAFSENLVMTNKSSNSNQR